MFPPETTHTIFRASTRVDCCRERGREGQPAGSLGDDARPLGQEPDGRGGLVDADRERAGEQGPSPLPHGRQERPAAGTVDERRAIVDLLGSAGGESRGERRARLGLHGVDAGRRLHRCERARDPGEEAAAAPGHEHDVGVGRVLGELEADRAVPRHHPLVLHRVHEQPVDAVEARFDERLPPALVRHLHHGAAEARDRVQLRLRRSVGHDDRRRHPELAGRPGDSLRHVARACRHDARPRSARAGPAGRHWPRRGS